MRKARKWLLLTVLKIANFQQVRKSISNFRQKLAKWQNLQKFNMWLEFAFSGDFYFGGETLKSFPIVAQEQQQNSSTTKTDSSSYSQGTTIEWRRKWVCPTIQYEPHDSIHGQSLRIKLNVKIGLLLFRLLVFLAAVNNSNSQALNS